MFTAVRGVGTRVLNILWHVAGYPHIDIANTTIAYTQMKIVLYMYMYWVNIIDVEIGVVKQRAITCELRINLIPNVDQH